MYDVALVLGAERLKDRPARGLSSEGEHPYQTDGLSAPGISQSNAVDCYDRISFPETECCHYSALRKLVRFFDPTPISKDMSIAGLPQSHIPPGAGRRKSGTPKARKPRLVTSGGPSGEFALPTEDNTPEGLEALLRANEEYRQRAWPPPYDATTHRLHLGDARDLSWIESNSVHLIVTSPPYWTLKQYREGTDGQMGDIADYENFLNELDKVWRECARVLVGGGRVCCVVGDVCIPRKRYGKHYIMPLHADIQVRCRKLGLDCLTPILWHKISNGATEVEGNGSGFYGKPYQPGSIVKNDTEYILSLRKGGEYRSVDPLKKALSMLTRDEMKTWLRSYWDDVKGASTKDGHPAPYPVDLALRLIRIFSFAGDTVLDPFAGTGSTALAAIASGRNSIGNEIDSSYLQLARRRVSNACAQARMFGAVRAEVNVD
jgi:DNA modification methylase